MNSEQIAKHHMEFLKELDNTYEKCNSCGKQRKNLREIHTYVCDCGTREWYPERWEDKLKQDGLWENRSSLRRKNDKEVKK